MSRTRLDGATRRAATAQSGGGPSDTGSGYDTTHLRALQDELQTLNAAALADGLLGSIPQAKRSPAAPPTPSKASRKRGTAAARRLLAIGGRQEGDDSPDVSGTAFTEAGVVRLLAFLRLRPARGGAWSRFLRRVERALGRPISLGQPAVAGVSLTRLQVVCRQIREVEAHGLAQLTARRKLRRSREAAAGASLLGGVAASRPGETS